MSLKRVLATGFVVVLTCLAAVAQGAPPAAEPQALSADLVGRLSSASGPVPVIIRFARDLDQVDWQELEGKAGGQVAVGYRFPAIDGVSATLPAAAIRGLARSPQVAVIEADEVMSLTLEGSNRWFGTQQAAQSFGLSGAGVAIAVLDTGIDASHVDLAGKVVAWKDYVSSTAQPYDDHGHGTHVAGIAAGAGVADPRYKGVASGANLVGIKVCDSTGSCNRSSAVAAVQWILDNQTAYNIRVMNLSFGSSTSSDGTDSLSAILNRAADSGVLPVVSAGNAGPGAYTLGSPAAAAKAVTVGAFTDVYRNGFAPAPWSSRGPTLDGRVKPDIMAPGNLIRAPRRGTVTGYFDMSGTSMASPFVAGVAGLMAQANPAWTPAQIKAAIMATAVDWGPAGPDPEYGAGRLDGYAAIEQAVLAGGGAMGGGNVEVPGHLAFGGQLSGTGSRDWYEVAVASTAYPLVTTLIHPDWSATSGPDFTVEIYDSTGKYLSGSPNSTGRQEGALWRPTATGTYKVSVVSKAGAGRYSLDVSAGIGQAPPPAPPAPPSAPDHWTSGNLETGGWSVSGSGDFERDYSFTPPAFSPTQISVLLQVSQYNRSGSDAVDKVAPYLEVWAGTSGEALRLIGTAHPSGAGTYTITATDPALISAVKGGQVNTLRLRAVSLNRKTGKENDKVSVSSVTVELQY